MKQPRHKSKFQVGVAIALRVLIVTVLFTLASFALGLLLGIIGVVTVGAIRGVRPDMTVAYRFVAAPLAVCGSIVTFVAMLVYEIRRQSRLPVAFASKTRTSLP
ncbi:MAG TPA: hypothetical protein VEG30_13485 [Terriglobales bacterium]|nr:hypothetical protein [Terriglobales bacterium]